ncbi:MAG: imidazolonepropionase [Flavobacteriaceae bacterium]
MKTLFKNIKGLLQVDRKNQQKISGEHMSTLPMIEDAYLLVENDHILDYGPQSTWNNDSIIDKEIDLQGRYILPGWCDSHTHIVYAGNREQEFVDRINGMTYEQIASRGGGILNSAQKIKEASFEELFEQSEGRLQEVISQGTTALEIKSGYGLDLENELKMLRVIKALKEKYDLPIKATFLGAHALPEAYKDRKNDYVDLIIDEMLPIIAKEGLADYIDVFCEKGYFDTTDTQRIVEAGAGFGLKAKLHVNQFYSIGGIQVATKNKALSVDHLEVLSEEDLENLSESEVMPVALPSCSYFLSIPYTPAKQIIEKGLALALASDYNPGSTPSGNMNFVVATACIKMKLTPEQAFNAATLNGAYAMDLQDEVGSIDRGKKANFIITKAINSPYVIPYAFGSNPIQSVYINGKETQYA